MNTAEPIAADAALPDLEGCAREPIHIPGSIQPQGALFVVDPQSLAIRQAAIAPGAGITVSAVLGRGLGDILCMDRAERLLDLPLAVGDPPIHVGMATFAGSQDRHHVVAHRSDSAIIIELERVMPGEAGSFEDVYPFMRPLLEELQTGRTAEKLGAIAARAVRRITGLDRVLVYRFDSEWNGDVIAEERNERLPSYLGLRFPASDIPAQARELYRLNRLRLIAASDYVPVPIEPENDPTTGKPVDLSMAALRSVSPVHLEYMRNMGTGASMSISLLRDGALWGLISCHHRDPVRVPYHVRTACDFIGQILSLQLSARESAAEAERRIELRAVQARLLAHMTASEQFLDSLIAAPDDLLALTHASGAAILSDGHWHQVGQTPGQPALEQIADWLVRNGRDDVIATDHLGALIPGAEAWKEQAAGMLAIAISKIHRRFILWFRPEVVQTVAWGGSPHKPVDPTPDGARIHPRKSFEVWKETVRDRSLPWTDAEQDASLQLRRAIIDIVLRRAEELAALNAQLVRSNKELEAFSYSVSHDLRAPFRHIVGYAELLKRNEGHALSERGARYIDTIIESAVSAGTLVDDLLNFSQMGRSTLRPMWTDMNQLVAEELRRLEPDVAGRRIRWQVGNLPSAYGDPAMLRVVIQNLLDNAVKFTRGVEDAVIEIGAEDLEQATEYHVRDNGAGFDQAYVGKLFGVFQRLHRVEEFEGTGIGLANVKRIVDQRHGGQVRAEGSVGGGATIYFTLPKAGVGK